MNIRFKKIKDIVMVLSIISFFLILTIVIIFLAQGRRITEDGKIVETGIITLESNPGDVDVLLAGETEFKKNVSRLTGLEPGIQNITVTKEGYTTWQKDIEVLAGRVVHVPLQIYPLEVVSEQMSSSSIKGFDTSYDAEYLVYATVDQEDSSVIELWSYKTTRDLLGLTNQDAPESFGNIVYEADEVPEEIFLNVSPDGKKVIVHDGSQFYRIIELNSNSEPLDINELIGFIPDYVDWSRNGDSLLILQNDLLYELDINSKDQNIISFNPGGDGILFARGDDAVFYIESEADKDVLYKFEGRSDEVELDQNFELPERFDSVYTPLRNENVVVLQSENTFYYFDFELEYTDVFTGAYEILDMTNGGDRILLSEDGELFTYFLDYDDKDTRSAIAPLDETLKEEGLLSIAFNKSDSIVIIKVSDDNADNLYDITVMDFDGFNKHTLLTDIPLVRDYLGFGRDRDDFYYVSLNQEENGEDSEVTSSLFRVLLEE